MIKHSQKGMTIIEVVMSLAILMVIMVSVSGLVGIVTKNKQFTHDKQGATLLGQEIIEQLQLTDSLTKNNQSKYYISLAGLNDLVNQTSNNLAGIYSGDINGYQSKLNLKQTEAAEINVFIKNKDEDEFTVTVNKKTFDMLKSEDLMISIEDGNINISNLIDISTNKKNIILHFGNNIAANTEINLVVNNTKPEKLVNVYLYQAVEQLNQVNVKSTLSDGVVLGWKSSIDSLYNYTLEIMKQDKLLFEAHGNKILTKR